jgi:hypothetical protein
LEASSRYFVFLFTLLVLLAGYVIAWLEGIKPAKRSWILTGLGGYFSAMTFIRKNRLQPSSTGCYRLPAWDC